ncbi:MAG TPA: tRNA (N6-isopentenyl adenosine(37)-C2)-methylthiotransferase MiaB [Kiritimatiellia bacterium]|nr:tRNA (N6-isopentenyl adenosine(37)-C2)-methylthiotransferase MiaB [Kiritimatiellia bacterium]HMO99285.1 tRNA (N6-isopentenyl adenosine(37)-C2)-methylthiotransferase MiaB [Kiritimatiellia bacterium]HMP95617.1 tRNA (N6-isopentenyl adenosine(37)-C2)-methylthiotransferase MiaB [Kiritimatiellia bacterium]
MQATTFQQRRYNIWTVGCQMNEADSRRMAQQLEFAGLVPSPTPEDADVVILNTCVVRQQAENKAVGKLGAIQAIKEQRPDLVIGLMGCMVGIREAPALSKRFPYVDVFMPPSETAPMLDHLEQLGWLEDPREVETRQRTLREAIQDEDLPLPAPIRGETYTANVPVVLGCSHACTFCVIPYRRGAERSRPMNDILTEIRGLAGQGIREVMLLGQIVDRYGIDFGDGSTLSLLLRRVAEIDGIERIRFLTSHPNYMTDELLETVASVDKVCPQIEVPVQAGNDQVLENMRRGYTNQQYRTLIARIREIIPEVAIHTDIIVGFPGETHEQFMDTYHLLKDLELDKAHLSKYSVRPKTIAARHMPDDVSHEEKRDRWAMLEALQKDILTRKNAAWRGQTVEVLVETRDGTRSYGRTRQGKAVYIEDDQDRRGQIVPVHLDWTGPFTLIGRPADTLRRGRTLEIVEVA